MKLQLFESKKFLWWALAVAVVLTWWATGFVKERNHQAEKSRLESLVQAAFDRTSNDPTWPPLKVAFITHTEKSITVVIDLPSGNSLTDRESLRAGVLKIVRADLGADPKSWGRYIAVIFNDELILQGRK